MKRSTPRAPRDIEREAFVNDISHATTENDIRQLLGDVGTIEKVEIDTNDLNRRFAFVTFSTKLQCDAAIRQFNSVDLQGSTLVFRKRSELDAMREARIREARCKLFVGNIPNDISRDELRNELQRLSERKVVDFRHKKGYCFLGFETPANANAAKQKLRNAMCRGKSLNVELKKEEPIRNDNRFISILEQAERTLYVRDIPPTTDTDAFKKKFEIYGKIRKFTVPTERNSKRLVGYSFIEYFQTQACANALKHSKGLVIDGQEVEVRISDPPKENSRKQRDREQERMDTYRDDERNHTPVGHGYRRHRQRDRMRNRYHNNHKSHMNNCNPGPSNLTVKRMTHHNHSHSQSNFHQNHMNMNLTHKLLPNPLCPNESSPHAQPNSCDDSPTPNPHTIIRQHSGHGLENTPFSLGSSSSNSSVSLFHKHSMNRDSSRHSSANFHRHCCEVRTPTSLETTPRDMTFESSQMHAHSHSHGHCSSHPVPAYDYPLRSAASTSCLYQYDTRLHNYRVGCGCSESYSQNKARFYESNHFHANGTRSAPGTPVPPTHEMTFQRSGSCGDIPDSIDPYPSNYVSDFYPHNYSDYSRASSGFSSPFQSRSRSFTATTVSSYSGTPSGSKTAYAPPPPPFYHENSSKSTSNGYNYSAFPTYSTSSCSLNYPNGYGAY